MTREEIEAAADLLKQISDIDERIDNLSQTYNLPYVARELDNSPTLLREVAGIVTRELERQRMNACGLLKGMGVEPPPESQP